MRCMVWIGVAALAAAGCTKAERAKQEPATKPVEPPGGEPVKSADPPTPAKPEITLGADEAIADRSSQLAWIIDGRELLLAAIDKGGKVVVRAYTADDAIDVTKPEPTGDVMNAVELSLDGATVVFKLHRMEMLAPGLSLVFRYTQIGWDAAAGAPVVRDTWSCATVPEDLLSCTPPAWSATRPAPADPGDAEQPPDPIEVGLDDAFMSETEGCKPKLDAKDEAYQEAYLGLCLPGLARVTACLKDKDFAAVLRDREELERVKQQLGTPEKGAALCEDLKSARFCGYQASAWGNPYDAADLRKMAAVPDGDCATLATVFPGPLDPAGE